jgi:hypothetical protein
MINHIGSPIAAPPAKSIIQWIGNDFKEFAFHCGSGKIARNILREKEYHTFEIAKKGTKETRTIEAPNFELKNLQKAALKALEIQLPHKAVHGFTKGKNNATAATEVAKKIGIAKATIIGQDLRKAFPTVTRDKVRAIWKETYPELTGWQLHTLGRLCCRNGVLATGSPISPHLLNLALKPLDKEMENWTANNGGLYLRYADDCVLVIYSHNRKRISKARKALNRAISRAGFTAHPEKSYATKVGIDSPAAEVVGAMVKPSEVKSRKRFRRKIRALANQYRRRLKARRISHQEAQQTIRPLQRLFARLMGLGSYAHYLTTKPTTTNCTGNNPIDRNEVLHHSYRHVWNSAITSGGEVRATVLRAEQEKSG